MVALRLQYRRCKEEVNYGYVSTQAVQESYFTGQIIGSTLLLPRCFRTWLQFNVATGTHRLHHHPGQVAPQFYPALLQIVSV